MGAIHVGLAAASAVYAPDLGWKLIGGATFGSLAALNILTDMRGAEMGSRYTTNLMVSLAIPMVLAGTYWGLELWAQSADEEGFLEPVDATTEETEPASEPEPAATLHLNVVPVADGAFTSVTLSF